MRSGELTADEAQDEVSANVGAERDGSVEDEEEEERNDHDWSTAKHLDREDKDVGVRNVRGSMLLIEAENAHLAQRSGDQGRDGESKEV